MLPAMTMISNKNVNNSGLCLCCEQTENSIQAFLRLNFSYDNKIICLLIYT